MSMRTMIGDSERFAPPETAVSIDLVRDFTIRVAEMDLNIKAIYDQFKLKEKYTRQDVRNFITDNKQHILGLDALEDAIQKKHSGLKAKRILCDAYDEIIDKMVDGGWLGFHVELSPESEAQLIEAWSKSTV